MYISQFQVSDYKSFLRSPEIALTPGFNVIVGQNDAGKTALLDVLSLRFDNCPHRSIETVPFPSSPHNTISKCQLRFRLEQNEGIKLLERTGTFHIPTYEEGINLALQRFLLTLEEGGWLECTFQPGHFASAYLGFLGSPYNGNYIAVESDPYTGEFRIASDAVLAFPVDYAALYGIRLAHRLRERIYKFNAERLNIKEARIDGSSVLAPDASNLASVLNRLLTADRDRFIELEHAIRSIFPHITRINAPPLTNNSTRIEINTTAPELKRSDLAIPLAECGTGISQALAILYVVFVAQEPQVIIIDEPQSFLHPGAFRKLFEILKQHSEHQYIITSHSPTAVTVTNPKTLLLVRRGEHGSTVDNIDTSETDNLRTFLREVGAKLSDVFGADAILWVEGPTEETCFPLLLEAAKQPLYGVQIVGVQHTGDFEGRLSKTAFEIYTRLSGGGGLLPPAIGFIFDREGRTEQQQEDLERQSRGKVCFLPRRMYENYLLNSNAISSVLRESDSSGETDVELQQIEDWLQIHGHEKKYFDAEQIPVVLSPEWLKDVHAARILKDLFSSLSQARVEYRKVEHGKKLTKWLVNNAPSDLDELVDLVKAKLSSATE